MRMTHFLRKAIALIMLGSAAWAFAQDVKYGPIVNAALSDLKTKTKLSLLSGHVAVNISSGNRELDGAFATALKEAYPNFTAKSGTVRNEDLYQMTVKIYREGSSVLAEVRVTNSKNEKIAERTITVKKSAPDVIESLQHKTALIAKNEFERYLNTAFDSVGGVTEEIYPSAEICIARGRAAFAKEDYKGALTEFNKALKAEPENAAALYHIANVYRFQENYDKAIEYYMRTININPVPVANIDYSDAYFERGCCYVEKKDFDKAIADFNKSIKLRPKNARTYWWRAMAYLDKYRYGQAIDDLTKSIKLDPKDELTYETRAIIYHFISEYDKAIKDFTAAIRIDPSKYDFYFGRAKSYYERGSYAKVMADCEKALKIKPNDDTAKDLLAKAEEEKRKADLTKSVDRAYRWANLASFGTMDRINRINDATRPVAPSVREPVRASVRQPVRQSKDESANTYNSIGIKYYNQGDYGMAIVYFMQAVTRDPNFAQAFRNRADAYYNKGAYDAAIADYTQVIKFNPENSSAFKDRADAYYGKGNYDAAIADYTQAVKLNPEDSSVFRDRGDIYFDKGNYDAAIADYTQVVKFNPENSSAFKDRADAYYGKGNYDAAIADYTQAVKLNPKESTTFRHRGDMYYHKGNYAAAIADYTQALKLNPEDSDLLFSNLGYLYYKIGNGHLAYENYKKALKINPDYEPAKKRLYELLGTGFMILVEGGTFSMGSPASERERDLGEIQHQITVTSFYMSEYEVTQKEWQDVMGNNPGKFKDDYLPVEQVSWYEAIEYCNKRSMKEGLTPAYAINGENVTWNKNADGYRLPTEAEWEYACRAGTTTPFNTGNNITTEQANYNGNYPYNGNAKGQNREKTTPVWSFAPNKWGLYDMHGNVWEWCWDWYENYPNEARKNPSGAVSGLLRVYRGGSWGSRGRGLRSAYRYGNTPSGRYVDIGFRPVRNAE